CGKMLLWNSEPDFLWVLVRDGEHCGAMRDALVDGGDIYGKLAVSRASLFGVLGARRQERSPPHQKRPKAIKHPSHACPGQLHWSSSHSLWPPLNTSRGDPA